MIKIFNKTKKFVIYWSVIFFWYLFLFSWATKAQDDLMWQLIEPAYLQETIISNGKNVNTVWDNILMWGTEVDISLDGVDANEKPSMIVKITKFLLVLTITLAVTMILYNGMIYIIQVWQGKDSKDLTKNIAYIVIWILIALFSVVIITLIQSIPSTLWKTEELPTNTYEHDQEAISFKNLL